MDKKELIAQLNLHMQSLRELYQEHGLHERRRSLESPSLFKDFVQHFNHPLRLKVKDRKQEILRTLNDYGDERITDAFKNIDFEEWSITPANRLEKLIDNLEEIIESLIKDIDTDPYIPRKAVSSTVTYEDGVLRQGTKEYNIQDEHRKRLIDYLWGKRRIINDNQKVEKKGKPLRFSAIENNTQLGEERVKSMIDSTNQYAKKQKIYFKIHKPDKVQVVVIHKH